MAFSREFSKALHISMIMNNIYIYIYIYIYICSHENDVSSRSPQWLCGKLCTWAHNVRLQHYSLCAHVHELPQSHSGDNRECPLFSWLHIYTACLVSVRFWALRVVDYLWLMTTYVIYIYIHRQMLQGNNFIQVWNIARHFPCLALGAWSISQSIELRRTFECDPY